MLLSPFFHLLHQFLYFHLFCHKLPYFFLIFGFIGKLYYCAYLFISVPEFFYFQGNNTVLEYFLILAAKITIINWKKYIQINRQERILADPGTRY